MKRQRKRQNFGFLIGLLMGLGSLIIFSLAWGERYLTPGPSNSGHEQVKCEYCHLQAKGSVRQQIQANVYYLLGVRPDLANFGSLPISNEICLACHQHKNERHPVYRFYEPRYQKVRQNLKPHLCISCHLEHNGKRITLETAGFCESCHKDLQVKKDLISIPHHQLIMNKRWQSCLGCHDFHGNHVMEIKKNVVNAISPQKIQAYFKGGPSPYSDKKFHKAYQEPHR